MDENLPTSEPYYIVPFRFGPLQRPYAPTVSQRDVISNYRQGKVTLPLGLDKNFIPALPCLWYCLQLPRTQFDLVRVPMKGRKDAQRLHFPHRIGLFPVPWPTSFIPNLSNPWPKLIITPDDLLEAEKFQCPVSVGVPGLPPGHPSRRLAKTLRRSGVMSGSGDVEMEAATLELLAAHRALSHGGIGFVSRSIDDKAFILLDTIESLWAQGKQSPRTVWRCLDRLARVAQRSFVDEEFAVLSHASSLTSFSEFPIGLMTLPYDPAPLCCRVPIAYRPLVPLTRAVLVELSPESTAYLQGQLKVLVAECIPTDDIVGRLSRRGWATAGRRVSDVANLTLRVQEISSAAELRSALREDTYDLLVISAHGFVDRNQHRTGFLCGHERVVEEELGPLPPIVCLSACQVSPRGRGTTNITDLMFRQGARVILGTLVPIDVRRNALLMARFFANITEALQGKMPKNSFEAVWQFTISSNAVNDILSSNASLAYWALERQGGQSVIEEFMLYRSRGRLRPSHIYRDTEAVLRDMAKDRGILDRFDAWMHSQGYLPESLFYVVLGWPERIVFYDDQYEKLFNQKATPTSLTDG